jgi:UDP-N-acetylglucosamine--N-acetylmuramyl-(pentapeptide) pyrophosphoryl-undecaprenol N-acetylglucosamine transferase
MNHRSPHIVFAGGGTGGHLFPGLAVAEQIGKNLGSPHPLPLSQRERGDLENIRITFAGTGKAFERREVAAAGWDYVAIPSAPAPERKSVSKILPFAVGCFRGYWAAMRFLVKEKVAAVVGLGGYGGAMMSLAAANRGIPLVLLEQNVVPGKATQWLADKADLVCTSFPETEIYFSKKCRVRCTGNPVRSGFLNLRRQNKSSNESHSLPLSPHPLPLSQRERGDFEQTMPVLLVLGGSGGARSLNEHVPSALEQLREHLAGWRIVHQTGEAALSATRARYEQLALPAETFPFLDHLPGILAETGLVVSRAGGTALAEIAAAGVPAVLIPYPHAKGRHQQTNAEYYAGAGAAAMAFEQPDGGSFEQALAQAIRPLLIDALCRNRMARAMRRLARPEAAAAVADIVCQRACYPVPRSLRRAA